MKATPELIEIKSRRFEKQYELLFQLSFYVIRQFSIIHQMVIAVYYPSNICYSKNKDNPL
jgi:hypothetical protein